jgi:hypothetical protein
VTLSGFTPSTWNGTYSCTVSASKQISININSQSTTSIKTYGMIMYTPDIPFYMINKADYNSALSGNMGFYYNNVSYQLIPSGQLTLYTSIYTDQNLETIILSTVSQGVSQIIMQRNVLVAPDPSLPDGLPSLAIGDYSTFNINSSAFFRVGSTAGAANANDIFNPVFLWIVGSVYNNIPYYYAVKNNSGTLDYTKITTGIANIDGDIISKVTSYWYGNLSSGADKYLWNFDDSATVYDTSPAPNTDNELIIKTNAIMSYESMSSKLAFLLLVYEYELAHTHSNGS